METCICGLCRQQFEVADTDLKFYEKIEVPTPKNCPMCRKLNRLIFRNDRKLYRRTCDLCKKSIISTYESVAPFPVYCPDCWWGDKWDSASFGRDFDFSRPFFEQWNELNKSVPHISLWQIQNQNSEFSHDTSYNKNCYMLFGADYNMDSYYSWSIVKCKDVCDCATLYQSERLYECVDCLEDQFCNYCQQVRNSSNCHFCFDLVNCHNCFGSSGLRNKSYFYFNKQLTSKEYEEQMKNFVWTPQTIYEMRKKAYETTLTVPRRYVQQRNCEECTGSYLGNCKNVNESFDCENARDVKYSLLDYETKDAFDTEVLFWNIEVAYNSQTLIKNCFKILCSYFLRDAKEVSYSNECYASQSLFGCVGLRNKKHCVLNKQYSKEQYDELMQRIIKHMGGCSASAQREREADARLGLVGSQPSKAELKHQEYGEFFPISIAPFAYNESAAFDYLPRLPREAVLQIGFRWKEENTKEYITQTYFIPESISEVPDSITNETLACENCGKNYRVVPQELSFYRNTKLPIPRWCFECRHVDRLARRGPRLLFNRKCNKCGADVRTAYAPNRPEIIYCEKCYLAAVY